MPPVDHDCSLRDIVVAMSNKIAKLEHELAQLKKAHVGPKSERSKMPRGIVASRAAHASRKGDPCRRRPASPTIASGSRCDT